MRAILTCALLLAGCYVATVDAPDGGGMALIKQYPVRGLYTDPNSNGVVVPKGALKVASNVVIERKGLAQARPGFAKSANSDGSVTAARLIPWQGSLLRVNASTTSWWNTPTTAITKTGSTNLGWPAQRVRAAEARKNLYLNTDDGVRKLTSTSDVVAELAGMTEALMMMTPTTTGSSGFCPDTYYVGYTLVVLRTDANGLVSRSNGLGSVTGHNVAGAARNFTVIAKFASLISGDQLEFYRTETTTQADVGREFFLTKTHLLTSAELSAGSFSFVDTTDDANLGADLYTNDLEEGVAGANLRPPLCKELALFKGSLFCADTRSAQTFRMRFLEKSDFSITSTGIGTRQIRGTRTNGSAVIATTGSIVGVQQHAMLGAGASWTSVLGGPVIITGISGANLTMSETWTGSTDGSPVDLLIVDTVFVGTPTTTGTNGYFPVGIILTDTGAYASGHQAFLKAFNVGDTITRNIPSTDYVAFATSDYSLNSGAAGIVIEERARNSASLALVLAQATHADEFLSDIGQALILSTPFTVDLQPNNVACSKTDKPESFPADLRYATLVGNEIAPVLRLVPTRDALWIFKTDGVWRLSGDAAPNWRIDPIDMTLKLVAADALVKLDDVIYCWTNRGVMAVSDNGVVAISDPIADKLEKATRYFADSAHPTNVIWMAADPTRSNVVLSTPDGATSTYPSDLLVFNTRTAEWVTWSAAGALAGMSHMVYNVNGLAGTSAITADIIVQRTSIDAAGFVTGDYSYSVTISSVTGTAIVIAGASGWTPVAGDAFVDSNGVVHVVNVVTNSTHFSIYDTGAFAEVVNAYKAFTSALVWQSQGDPSSVQRWRETIYAFDQSAGIYAFTPSIVSTQNVSVSATRSMPSPVAANLVNDYTRSVRSMVTRANGRSTVVYPGITIAQALSPWRLSGLAMVGDAFSTRVSR